MTTLFNSLRFAFNPDRVKTRGPPYLQSLSKISWSAASTAGHSLATATPHSHDLANRPLVWSQSKLSFTPLPFVGQAEIVLNNGDFIDLMGIMGQVAQGGVVLALPEPDVGGWDEFDAFSTITAESQPDEEQNNEDEEQIEFGLLLEPPILQLQ